MIYCLCTERYKSQVSVQIGNFIPWQYLNMHSSCNYSQTWLTIYPLRATFIREKHRKWWSSFWALHHVLNQAITKIDSFQIISSVSPYIINYAWYHNLKCHMKISFPTGTKKKLLVHLHYLAISFLKKLTVYSISVVMNVDSLWKYCSSLGFVY